MDGAGEGEGGGRGRDRDDEEEAGVEDGGEVGGMAEELGLGLELELEEAVRLE